MDLILEIAKLTGNLFGLTNKRLKDLTERERQASACFLYGMFLSLCFENNFDKVTIEKGLDALLASLGYVGVQGRAFNRMLLTYGLTDTAPQAIRLGVAAYFHYKNNDFLELLSMHKEAIASYSTTIEFAEMDIDRTIDTNQ